MPLFNGKKLSDQKNMVWRPRSGRARETGFWVRRAKQQTRRYLVLFLCFRVQKSRFDSSFFECALVSFNTVALLLSKGFWFTIRRSKNCKLSRMRRAYVASITHPPKKLDLNLDNIPSLRIVMVVAVRCWVFNLYCYCTNLLNDAIKPPRRLCHRPINICDPIVALEKFQFVCSLEVSVYEFSSVSNGLIVCGRFSRNQRTITKT